MNPIPIRIWLALCLAVTSLTKVTGQSLTLSNVDPNGSSNDAFDGNVFQAGNQFGDATIYALLSGGAQSFQIVSPAESLTKTITSSGYFTIRPLSSMVVDKSKILNFSGAISGTVTITVKPLSITTISANVATDVAPGSDLTVSYRTGAGAFPAALASGKFKVQLLDNSGSLISDLLNSTDQYTTNEKASSSRGDIRSIKATIPTTIPSGTYRVRVITQGLTSDVIGSASSQFTIKVLAPTIAPGSVGTSSYCPGAVVAFPFSTTGSFPAGDQFKVQLVNPSGTIIQDLDESSTSSPVYATLPTGLAGGTYKFRIVSSATGVISTTNTISLLTAPSLTISGTSSIIAGAQAPVQLAFTGTPPYSFTFVDYGPAFAPTYVRASTSSTNSLVINPVIYSTTTYDRSFIKSFKDSGCGTSQTISSAAQITVSPLVITTSSLSASYCPGTTISVPFTTNSSLPADAICQILLSDINGNFDNGQVIGTGGRTSPISATIPQNSSTGAGYNIKIVFQSPIVSGVINYNDVSKSVPTSLIISRPDAPKVTDIYFCSGTTLSQLTATGTNLKWYNDGSNQQLANAPVPPNDRSSRYWVTQTINGCESASVAINVYSKQTPSAPSVSNVTLCQGAQGQFSTSIPNPIWYTTATGGTGSTQPPALNNQASGDQIVYVTQTVDGCESARAAVKATVFPIPLAPVVQPPTPICQNATGIPLTATGQNLSWYDQSGKLSGTPTPITSTTGVQSYSVTQTVNGCESPKSFVEQLIRPAPANPVSNSVRYCVGDVPKSLTASGSNIKWYTSVTGGTASSNSPAFFTESPAVITFYVTQTDNNNCESARQPVSVSVVAPPSPPTVIANQIVCQFTKANPLTASPNAGLQWQGTGITGIIDTAPTPNTTQPATFTYSVSQKSGTCVSTPASITYTVRKLPDPPKVVSPVAFCIGQTSSAISATADNQLTWYINADHSGPASTQVFANTAKANVATFYVTQTDSYKCESLNSSVEIRVSAKSTARLSGDGEIYPGDSTAIRVYLSGDGPWTFNNWSGQLITAKDSLYVKWERPTATRTYAITNLKSACGTGDILNSYTLLVRTPLGIQSQTEPLSLNVYPNPTNGEFYVDWSSPVPQSITLQIISNEGKIIKESSRQTTSALQSESFKLNNQPPGIYILKVMTDKNGVMTRQILKQ